MLSLRVRISFAGLFSLSALILAPAFADATALPNSVFNLIMRSDGLCMDVYGNQAVSGQNIDNWRCNGTTAQTFRAESLGGDVYRVINTNSGMCVDVYGNDTSEGADVVQSWCNGSSSQSFHSVDAGGGYVYLVNTNSNKCVGFGGTFQWQMTDQGNWQWVPDVRMYTCNGAADRQWYPATPASCSVSLSPNPKAYAASATLSWSSSNAQYSLYINNVGYVGGSGAISVAPSASTDYSCTANGYGGSDGWHSATLVVNPPASCSLPWGGSLAHGGSVTAYQSSTVPYGSACSTVSQTRSCSNGSLSGSYQYQSCTVNNPPPTCALSLSPTAITRGQSSTLSWSSTNATSCTGTNFSTGGSTAGSASVSPSSSTTYTASCTGPGGTAQCTGTGSGGVGAALTVSCAQSWSCTGGGQTITQTNTDCSTTNLTTCVSPNFCTSGSAACITPVADGTISVAPPVVRSGATTRVTWSTTNTASCTVTGGSDSWTGTSGVRTSSPISGKIVYTLRCDDGDPDTIENNLTKSVTAYTVTTWKER